MTPKRLLIVEPSRRPAKECIVRALARRPNLELVFASGLTELFDFSWIRPYASGLIPFSYHQDDAVAAVTDYCRRQHVRFDGVLTYVEFAIPTANRLQHALGLPPLSRQRDAQLRNKFALRQLFAGCEGVRQPPCVKLASLEEGRAYCKNGDTTFPAVMKPTEFCAGLATRIVRNEAELLEFLPVVLEADFPTERLRRYIPHLEHAAIVESFVPGEQFSAEVIVTGGRPHVLGLTHKHVIEQDGFFTAASHRFPDGETYAKHRIGIDRMIQQSHAALELENTFTNVDFKIDERGPVLIEINVRIGGDVLPELFELVHGPRLIELLAAVALGENADATHLPTQPTSATATHLYSAIEGIALDLPRLETHGSADNRIVFDVQPGDFLVRPSSGSSFRLAHVLTPSATPPPLSLRDFPLRPAVGVYQAADGQPLMVVAASLADVAEMARVERASWTPRHAAPLETIHQRVRMDPLATVLVFTVDDRKLVGFFTGVRLSYLNLADIKPWSHYASLAAEREVPTEENLPFLKGVSLTVHPDAPRGTATQLMRGAQQHFRSVGIQTMVTLGRPVGYAAAKAAGIGFESYYGDLLAGRRKDPTFSVFKRAGATPAGFVPRFFDDPESDDYGLVFVHDLLERDGK
jgi:hypothetical protein